MPKHVIILQFCIEIDIPFTRILIPHYIIHFPIKPFIIDSDTLLNKQTKKNYFFLEAWLLD
jgi:hypothetical protein